jgi:hypothetical protein
MRSAVKGTGLSMMFMSEAGRPPCAHAPAVTRSAAVMLERAIAERVFVMLPAEWEKSAI